MRVPPHIYTPEQDAEIVRLKHDGVTWPVIAERIGGGNDRRSVAKRYYLLKKTLTELPKTQEQKDRELVERAFVHRARGLSCANAAKAMEVSENFLRSAMRRLKVEWNPGRKYTLFSREDILNFRKRRDAGETIVAIAESIGANVNTLKNVLRGYNQHKDESALEDRRVYGMSAVGVEPFVKKPPRKILPDKPVVMALARALVDGKISRQQFSDGLRGYPVPLGGEG